MSTPRTDTDRLNWLVQMGYLPELGRLFSGGWLLEGDRAVYVDKSDDPRAVIDQAMDAEEAR